MSKSECCGNCKHFKYEDADGLGFCEIDNAIYGCGSGCLEDFKPINNGWTEITPDNVDMIDACDILIVTDGTYYNKASDWHLSIGTMAKYGGYWYYVLPELKIE